MNCWKPNDHTYNTQFSWRNFSREAFDSQNSQITRYTVCEIEQVQEFLLHYFE